MKVIGKADRNRTIGEMINGRPRSGVDYIDLETGNLLKKSGGENALDLNKDGTFDEKDKSIAGTVLATRKRGRRKK